MEYINNYSPVGDLGIIVLCFIMILSLRESFVFSNINFKIFVGAILFVAGAASSNLFFYMVCVTDAHPAVIMIFRALYRICLIFTLQFFIVYLYRMLLIDNPWIVRISGTVNLGLCMMDIIEPLLDWVSYYSPFSLAFFTSYVFSLCVCWYLIYRYSKAIIRPLRRTIICTQIVCIILIALEYVYEHNSFMTFTFFLPILVVMFMAHSNPYSLKTGALNLDSFDDFLAGKNSERTHYICLKFMKKEAFKMSDQLGIVLKSFWQEYFKKAVLFNPTPEFVVLAVNDDMESEQIRDIVETLMQQVFPKYYGEFQLDYKVVVFNHIGSCASYREFVKIYDFFATDVNNNTYKICDDSDLAKLYRYDFILNQLQDIYDTFDLDDPRVLVYCQPIKNTSRNVYDTAEALMRLRVPEIGFIFPNEFIPLIEKYHLIHRFSMIILNKVCKQLKELDDYDMSRISVNFSIYELRDADFINDFKRIVESNGVPFSKIGVEFTESTDIDDFEILKNVIAELRELGCTIYLDDFGTGYSNFERILGLSLHVVKFDRSLLLMASDDVKAQYFLKSFSDAFMKMHFKVLYEGVETNEQESLCVNNHADYLQGFKYSKPIPMNELEDFLKKNSVK